jgi:hypothetical protein
MIKRKQEESTMDVLHHSPLKIQRKRVLFFKIVDQIREIFE